MTVPDRVDVAMAGWPLDGPYDPESTVDAARTIAELVRYLNNATAPWKGPDCLRYPFHLRSVVANLRGALYDMEQLCRQLAARTSGFAEDSRLYDDRGGDPAAMVAEIVGGLRTAAGLLPYVATVLGQADEAANRLGIRD